jgi:hypothetical protein
MPYFEGKVECLTRDHESFLMTHIIQADYWDHACQRLYDKYIYDEDDGSGIEAFADGDFIDWLQRIEIKLFSLVEIKSLEDLFVN